MTRFEHFPGGLGRGGQRVFHVWQTVNRQPSWVVRLTLMAFVLIVVLPIVVLMLLAFIVAGLVFSVLWGANRLFQSVRGGLSGRSSESGRENVRVIPRE